MVEKLDLEPVNEKLDLEPLDLEPIEDLKKKEQTQPSFQYPSVLAGGILESGTGKSEPSIPLKKAAPSPRLDTAKENIKKSFLDEKNTLYSEPKYRDIFYKEMSKFGTYSPSEVQELKSFGENIATNKNEFNSAAKDAAETEKELKFVQEGKAQSEQGTPDYEYLNEEEKRLKLKLRDSGYKLALSQIKLGENTQAINSLLNLAKLPYEKPAFPQGGRTVMNTSPATDSNILYNIGRAYHQIGEEDEAKKYYADAVKTDPQNFTAYRALGYAEKDPAARQEFHIAANIAQNEKAQLSKEYDYESSLIKSDEEKNQRAKGLMDIVDQYEAGVVYPYTHFVEPIVDGLKKAGEGVKNKDAAETMAGLVGAAFSSMRVIPATAGAMAAFDAGLGAAEKILPQEAFEAIMTPVSYTLKQINPSASTTDKSGAEIGDVIYQFLLFKGAHEGVKGIKGSVESLAKKIKENEPIEREEFKAISEAVADATPEEIKAASQKAIEEAGQPELPKELLDLKEEQSKVALDLEKVSDPIAKEVLLAHSEDLQNKINSEEVKLAEETNSNAKKAVEAERINNEINSLEAAKNEIESETAKEAIQKRINELRPTEGQEAVKPTSDAIRQYLIEVKERTPEEVEQVAKESTAIRSQSDIDFIKELDSLGMFNAAGEIFSSRIDLKMSTKEVHKALSDIEKGNYETAPVKHLAESLKTAKETGEFDLIQGVGGNTIKSGLTLEEILLEAKDNPGELSPEMSTFEREMPSEVRSALEEGVTLENIDSLKDQLFGGFPFAKEDFEITKKYLENERSRQEQSTNESAEASEQSQTTKEAGEIISTEAGAKESAEEVKPVTAESSSGKGEKKSLLNRGYEGVSEEAIKSSIEKHGLTYEVESHESAKQNASNFIEEVGIENALEAVRKNQIEDGAAAFVWGKLIDDAGRKLVESTDPAEQAELTKIQGELISEFDKKSRSSGRFISALKDVYENSDFEYNYASQVEKYKSLNKGEISPEVEAKFKAYDEELKVLNKKILELQEKAKEQEAAEAVEKIVKEARRKKRNISKEALKEERKSLLNELAEIAKKQRGTLSANPIPVEMLPVITKLARNYIETGIIGLADVVDKIHEDLKGYVDGLTTRDVRDAITGYGKEPKKQTRDDIAIAISELKKQGKLISRLEDLQAGKRPFKTERTRAAESAEIIQLKEKIKQVYKELGFEQEEKLSSVKTRLKNKTQELQEKLTKGDFEKPKREKLQLDEEALNLEIAKNKVKEKFDVEVEKARLKNRTTKEKITDTVLEAGGALKSFAASADLSAPLRQGAILSFANPKAASKATVEMFRQAFSEKNADKWLQKLKDSPEYPLIKESKLYISEPTTRLTAKEERFMTNLPSKIPYLKHLFKGSERAYTGYLNKLRVDVFADGVELLKQKGLDPKKNSAEFKAWAEFINNATGRGSLGGLEKSAVALNNVFFSPRYVASRFNLLNPVTYASMPKPVAKMAMRNVLTYLGVGSAVAGLAAAAGADVELDPRSADFGKIKIGDTRVDVWAGEQQWVRFLAQIASGERKSTTTGKVSELSADVFPGKTRLDVIGDFFRSKLAPASSLTADVLSGKTAMGEPLNPKDMVLEKVIPLYLQDMYELYSEEDLDIAMGLTLPALFGASVQHYGDKGMNKQSLEDLFQKRKEPRKSKTPEELKEIHDRKEKLEYDRKQAAKKLGIEYVPPKGGVSTTPPKNDNSGLTVTPISN